MKGLKRVVFISFLVLLVLIFAFFLVKMLTAVHTPKENGIYDSIDYGDFCEIKVQKGKEEPYFVTKKEDVTINGLENIPLNKQLTDMLFNFFKEIFVERIFKAKENLNGYGLEEPSFIFDVKSQEEKLSLKVGKKTVDNEGYYIMTESGGKKGNIAIVDRRKIEPILVDKKGFLNLKLFPYYEKTFGEEDKKYNGDGVRRCVIKRKDLKEDLIFKTDENGELVAISPKGFKIDDEIKNIIEKGPNMFVAKEVFKIKPSKKELKDCGIEAPNATIEYKIDDKTYTLKILNVFKVEQIPDYGEKSEKVKTVKFYYIVLEGVDAIYIANENVLPWLEINEKK